MSNDGAIIGTCVIKEFDKLLRTIFDFKAV